MNVLSFAVCRSVSAEPGIDFFGAPIEMAPHPQHHDLVLACVAAHGRPLVSDETLAAHHAVVAELSEMTPTLPHRFGLIADLDRLLDDVANHSERLRGALSVVENAHEWSIRAQVQFDEAARRAVAVGPPPRAAGPLELGRFVHESVARTLTGTAENLERDLGATTRWCATRVHDDRLGFDLELVSPDADAGTLTEAAARNLGGFDVEIFGPTPCYRYAGAVVAAMAVAESSRSIAS